MLRPGLSLDAMEGISTSLQDTQEIIRDIGTGRSSHGLPLAWPVTESDVDATYLAGLEKDDEVRMAKVEEGPGAVVADGGPNAVANKGGTPSLGPDGITEGHTGQRSTSGPTVGGGGPAVAQASTSTQKPEAVQIKSTRRTHRGQKCIYDGRAIAGFYAEEIRRQTQLTELERAKHLEFTSKMKYTQDCYEHGMDMISAVCSSGITSEEATSMLARCVSETVKRMRGSSLPIAGVGIVVDRPSEGGSDTMNTSISADRE